MERLVFFLGLLVFSDACGLFEDLDPDGGSALSTGTPAPFPNGKAKLMAKPSSEEDSKLGLYLKDEVEDIVAGVTLHQIKTSVFVSFYERRNGTLTKVFTHFVDKHEPLFKPSLWASVTVTHVDDVMTVDILPEKYGYSTTVKGLVRTQHRLPLRIYAKALQGPVFSTVFHYPGEEVTSDTASAFLGDNHFSSVYICPDQSFRFASVILLMGNTHQIFNLTSDDLIPGQCNHFKYYIRRNNKEMQLQLYLPEKRRCTRFTEEKLSQQIERSYLVANSPVQLITAKGIPRYHYDSSYYDTTYTDNYEMKRLSLPPCDSKEEAKCLLQRIGFSNHSSELVHLRNRVDFAIQPRAIVSGRMINFGIWLQEIGNLLAGVHIVQEGDGDVQLNFHQVLNNSYKLTHSQSLGGVKLDPKNVTFLFLTYTGSEVEVGLKTSLEGKWHKSKTAMALENKAPISAFLWSKEDMMIAMNCPWKDFQFNMTLQTRITSSLWDGSSASSYLGEVFFFPTSEFKVGTISLSSDKKEAIHIKKADIVPAKWNYISKSYRGDPFITVPASNFCPVMLNTEFRYINYVYTNLATDWVFDKPTPELGEISFNERCALDGGPGCSITTIGFKKMEHVNFVGDKVTFGEITQDWYDGESLLMIISDGPHRMASLRLSISNKNYFLVSEDLGFESKITDMKERVPSKVSLRRREDGHVEFTSWFSNTSGRMYNVSFTSNKTLPAPTEGHALTYTVLRWDLQGSVKIQYLAIDDSQTSVIFRSKSNWTTSLMFHLRDVAGTDEGSLQVVHGPSVKGIRLIYSGEGPGPRNIDVPDVNVQTNRWVELTLQILERILKVGLRTQEEPTWKNLEFTTKRTDPRPLVAVIESLHQHEVVLRCKRESGQFAVADDPSPSSVLLAEATLALQQQPEMAIVQLAKTGASGHIAVGQKYTFLVRGEKGPSLVLLQFSHRNGGMSVVTLEDLPLNPRKVLEIYLDNTDQDEGVSTVEVPALGESRRVLDLSNPGPVEHVRVFSSEESVWFFNSCGHVARLVEETTDYGPVSHLLEARRGEHEQDGMMEMAAFPGDSALFIWGKYLQNANVYLYHKNGNVTIRNVNLDKSSSHGAFVRLRNVLDEKSFAAMTGTSGELESLDYTGPVQNVTVVHHLSRDNCIVLLKACQAK